LQENCCRIWFYTLFYCTSEIHATKLERHPPGLLPRFITYPPVGSNPYQGSGITYPNTRNHRSGDRRGYSYILFRGREASSSQVSHSYIIPPLWPRSARTITGFHKKNPIAKRQGSNVRWDFVGWDLSNHRSPSLGKEVLGKEQCCITNVCTPV
jgi:hypothetical protein